MRSPCTRWPRLLVGIALAARAAAQDGDTPAWHRGALNAAGTTVDPASLPNAAAPRTWAPAPPEPDASTRPRNARIVSYADKWTRHGLSNYMPWRWPDGPFAERRADGPMTVCRDTDVDGDGNAADDFVASYAFSLELPLSNPSWPQHLAFPEIINQRFYGGASWFLGNTEPGTHSVWIEQGYNPDHNPPWFDDRAEDHPLQGQANERQADSVLKLYWAILWKKADFLNGADRCRVTFDESSRLAVLVARTYWLGYDDVRMLVQDGADLWISDNTGFDIPGAGGYTPERDGRVFTCWPTRTLWTRYTPVAHRMDFDPAQASFAPRSFADVQAVGWYLAKTRTDSGPQAHCKWYGFEADAVVQTPAPGDVNLATVAVPASAGVPAFRIATYEWPYDLWRRVHRWGNVPFNTLQARYVYDTFGQMGSMACDDRQHSADEPVTGVRFYDALAMCNTLSEYEGRRPCYYLDGSFTNVFRNQHLWTRAKANAGRQEPAPGSRQTRRNPLYEPVVQPVVYVDWSADGHRLPTLTEWQAARRLGRSQSAAPVAGTRAVNAFPPDAAGLRGMHGNVWELVWTQGDASDPTERAPVVAVGSDFTGGAAGPLHDCAGDPRTGSSHVGLRTVWRASGLPRPEIGTPLSAQNGLEAIPVWEAYPDTRRAATHATAPEPAPEMVKLPGGTFPRPVTESDTVEVFVSPFELARTETTYAQWRRVKQWAEARGWSFSLDGDMGSMYWYRFEHSPDEPVVHVTGHDLMVWCNALSIQQGRTPCYYTDEQTTLVYTNAFKERPIRMSGELAIDNRRRPNYTPGPYHDPFIFCRWDTDGYRLPTAAEWQFAATEGGRVRAPQSAEQWRRVGWSIYDSGGRTHPVGLKAANAFGLHDLWGNAAEWLWSGRPGSPPRPVELDRRNPKDDPYWSWDYDGAGGHPRGRGLTVGGSFLQAGGGDTVAFHLYYPDVGFRVARCEAGTHPRDGREPLADWPKVLPITAESFDPIQAGPSMAANACWRGNTMRTGEYRTSGVVRNPTVKWSVDTGAPVRSSPVVCGGVLYIGTGGGVLALDAQTGTERWKLPVAGGVMSSACVVDGVVYVGGGDGRLYALDAATGAVRWKEQARGPIHGSPAVAYGAVFVEGPVAFDAVTGAKRWGKRIATYGDERLSSPAILGGALIQNVGVCDIQEGRFTVGSGDSWIGENVEAVAGDTVFHAASGTGGGMGSLGGGGGALVALDLTTLKPRWTRSTAVAADGKREVLLSSPAVSEGLVYVGSDHGELLAFEVTTGKKAWATATGGPIRSSPAISTEDGTVYVGSDDGSLHAFDVKSGTEKWSFKTGGKIRSSPCPADGVVFIGSDDGRLHAIGEATRPAPP